MHRYSPGIKDFMNILYANKRSCAGLANLIAMGDDENLVAC